MIALRRLRTRLFLTYTTLLLVGIGVLALLAGQQIERGAVEDYEQALISQVTLVARGLREGIEEFREGGLGQAGLLQLVQTYTADIAANVVLIDPSGRAWLSSEDALPLENLASQPEVAAALNRQTTYDTRDDGTGNARIYAAAPIMEDGNVLSVVRLDAPLTAAQPLIARRWLELGGGVLLLLLLNLGASTWLSVSLTRPLDRLRRTALSMAEGDLSQRLPSGRQDEIGQLADAFNHMAGQVEAMLEEQRAFASNASHELRTPLTTIRLRSEALREGALEEETARQYIVEIDEEVRRLGQLVEALLLLSRLDSGRAERGDQQVDTVRLARHLMQQYAPQATSAQVRLELDAGADLPPVTASLSHLRIVFRNLLDNAIKYTPAGGLVCWKLAREGAYLHATIADSGRGVAAEDLPHLFERFYRADKARTRDVPGTGLGLALAQALVHAYQGRILVSSSGPGQGTTVDVWWPLQPAA